MMCPKCNERTKVGKTVNNPWQGETYRQLMCTKCGHVFYSVEFEAEVNDRFRLDWEKHKNQ